MSDRKFEVTVLERYCKGCSLCIEFCPTGKLYIRQMPNKQGIQTADVRQDVDCTGCMQCATICPDAAVQITEVRVPVAGKSLGRQ